MKPLDRLFRIGFRVTLGIYVAFLMLLYLLLSPLLWAFPRLNRWIYDG